MLRLLLNAHPRIAIPGEMEYFPSLPREKLENWQDHPVDRSALQNFMVGFLDRHDFRHIDTEQLQNNILNGNGLNYKRPYELALRTWADAENKARWGEKTPTNFFYVDIMHEMFPDAQFVHLVRDPRAVVHSMNRFIQMTDDTFINAHNWRLFIEDAYSVFQEVIPEDQRTTIRYEDLTAAPEDTARSLCDFLDEPFDPEMLQFHESSPKYMHDSFDEFGGSKTVTKPIRKPDTPKWKNGLSPREIGVIELICGDAMKQFGYKPTGHSPGPREYVSYLVKTGYFHWKQWAHRGDRFHLIRYQPFARLSAN